MNLALNSVNPELSHTWVTQRQLIALVASMSSCVKTPGRLLRNHLVQGASPHDPTSTPSPSLAVICIHASQLNAGRNWLFIAPVWTSHSIAGAEATW